jgi:hypothetical protein
MKHLGLYDTHAWKQNKETLCSYLYIKLAKNAMFLFFIFYVFSSTKSENRRLEQVLLRGGGGLALAGGG